MKKHLKPTLAYLLFCLLLSWYVVLVIRYTEVMMYISLGIVTILIYTAFYKAFND